MIRAASTVLAACMLASACSVLGTGVVDPNGPGVLPATAPGPAAALASVRPGMTAKDVVAALGGAAVVPFDSGWQVWVYRWLGRGLSAGEATELVVLFDPNGTVRKVRLRAGAGHLAVDGSMMFTTLSMRFAGKPPSSA